MKGREAVFAFHPLRVAKGTGTKSKGVCVWWGVGLGTGGEKLKLGH